MLPQKALRLHINFMAFHPLIDISTFTCYLLESPVSPPWSGHIIKLVFATEMVNKGLSLELDPMIFFGLGRGAQ